MTDGLIGTILFIAAVAGVAVIVGMVIRDLRRRNQPPPASPSAAVSVAQASTGGFCPKCGNQRLAASRFCQACGFAYEAAPASQPADPTAEVAIRWVWVIGCLAGAVWLWINFDLDPLYIKVITVGVFWAVWVGIVSVAVAIVALFLGMVGMVVQPFRRR